MGRKNLDCGGAKNAIRRWCYGRNGNRLVWLLLIGGLLAGLILDLSTDWGAKSFAFQRTGALLTAIFVPWFAFVFGKLTIWRSHLFAEKARVEAKQLLAWQLEALAKAKGLDKVDQIDKVLQLSAQKDDIAAMEPTIALLEKSSMFANACALFTVTIVWGFGDLFAGCLRKLMVQIC